MFLRRGDRSHAGIVDQNPDRPCGGDQCRHIPGPRQIGDMAGHIQALGAQFGGTVQHTVRCRGDHDRRPVPRQPARAGKADSIC